MLNQAFVTCRKCQYEKNLTTDRNCQFCGASLLKRDSVLTGVLLTLGGLGVLGTGTFLLNNRVPLAPIAQDSHGLGTMGQGTRPELLQTKSSEAHQGSFTQIFDQISDVPKVPQGIFTFGGSTTFAPLRSAIVNQTIAQAFPNFQLRYTEPTVGQPGSGTGIKMLLHSQLSFAQSSRELKASELAQAGTKSYSLEEVPIALDGIAIFINPQLFNRGLSGLTMAQVQGIFTGKITNWKQVGGPNFAIIPFSRDLKAGGTVDFFSESVLEKQAFGSQVRIVRDTTAAIRRVAEEPSGISYASASEVIAQKSVQPLPLFKKSGLFASPCEDNYCTAINSQAFLAGLYPITRRLFVIIKRDGGLDEQAGVAYANILLSAQGQQLINQAGFVAIR